MSKLAPDHWRYRYARRMRVPLLFLNGVMIAALVAAVVLPVPLIALIAILVMMPVVAPMAALGCYRCNFNVLRSYRGPTSPEHGDSWTRDWRPLGALPRACPKCGAVLLSTPSAD